MGMHRDQARRAAGRARIAAAGLGLAGAAVLFAPFPKLGVAPAGQPIGPGGTVAPTPVPAPAPAPIDADMWTRVGRDAGPEARPDAPPPEENPDTAIAEGDPEAPSDEPPPSTGPELRYLGPIVGPRRTLAMVALDGHQHVIAVGEEFNGKTVRTVAPDHIVLDDAQGVEHIIALAERTLDWSMDSPATPKTKHSKTLGANGRANNAVHDEGRGDADQAIADMEQKRIEAARANEAARRLAEQERGGGVNNDDPAIANPPVRVNTPTRPVQTTPTTSRPNNRGVSPTQPPNPNSPPRTPPSRPTVPVKGKVDEKKAGNQV